MRIPALQPGRRALDRRYPTRDRKSTRLNSSHLVISYAVFCLKKKKNNMPERQATPFGILEHHRHEALSPRKMEAQQPNRTSAFSECVAPPDAMIQTDRYFDT